MRILVACLVLLTLTPTCLAAGDDSPDLKSIYANRRWFELRDSVAKGAAPVFYQGAVACSFNDLHRCEKKPGAFTKPHPQSDDAIEAHKLLASAYLRQGKYREVLLQVNAVLALGPGDADAKGADLLLTSFGEFPDQGVARTGVPAVELQDGGLPLSINGVQATHWFDTGANVSILGESEAKRIGLAVRALSAKIGVGNGARIDLRVAVARELSIGSIQLKHVPFPVFPDDQPAFNEPSPGSGGLIGIPVLLGLQRFGWGAVTNFEIGPKSLSRQAPHADLCFDGNTLVAQIEVENRSLTFVLDTGATNIDLFPPFAAWSICGISGTGPSITCDARGTLDPCCALWKNRWQNIDD
jgi:hypothetical protein